MADGVPCAGYDVAVVRPGRASTGRGMSSTRHGIDAPSTVSIRRATRVSCRVHSGLVRPPGGGSRRGAVTDRRALPEVCDKRGRNRSSGHRCTGPGSGGVGVPGGMTRFRVRRVGWVFPREVSQVTEGCGAATVPGGAPRFTSPLPAPRAHPHPSRPSRRPAPGLPALAQGPRPPPLASLSAPRLLSVARCPAVPRARARTRTVVCPGSPPLPPSCFVSRAPRPRPVLSSLCLVLVLLVRAVHACCQWPVLCDGVVVYERAGFFVVGGDTEMFTLVGGGSFGLLSGVFIVVVATAGAVSVCGPVPVWTSSRRGRVEGAEGHDSVLDFSVSGWRGVGVADSEMRAVGWAQSFPMSQGVRAGRRWVRGHLDSLEWAKSAPDVVDSVLLAVTELITNAHKHARSDAQLVLTWDSACLHVSVHDSSPEPPVPSDRGLDATGGRGLAIVQALSDGWEHHPQRDGKTVTACFVPPGYPAPDQALSPDGAD
ncbi:Histidine kinase-like ATPase domain-containing protein [Streptomyces sp. OspMP-M43]|nr:Histidine kinase-like ATPase domain-containing protein [Streptomyces sp. OspMP-M43]